VTLLGEFGQAAVDLASDFNVDGRVDLQDFVSLRSNFGNTLAVPTFPASAPMAIAAPAAAMMAPVVDQRLDVIDENYVSARNDDAIASPLTVEPVVDILVESPLPGEYVSNAPASPAKPETQFAATGEYDLQPLGDDLMPDGQADDLLADILAEAALAPLL